MVEMINEVDEDLLALFDRFSHYKNGICYGRYDIKCESLESLKKGENFKRYHFFSSLSTCSYLAFLRPWMQLSF